jgi:hypothetical protein
MCSTRPGRYGRVFIRSSGMATCSADGKAIGVSPVRSKNRVDEAMDLPNAALVWQCFRILNPKDIGLTVDITRGGEFRVLELVESDCQERIRARDGGGPELPGAIARKAVPAVYPSRKAFITPVVLCEE